MKQFIAYTIMLPYCIGVCILGCIGLTTFVPVRLLWAISFWARANTRETMPDYTLREAWMVGWSLSETKVALDMILHPSK